MLPSNSIAQPAGSGAKKQQDEHMASGTLAQLSQAESALAIAETFEDIKQIRDIALAAQEYAKAAKLGFAAQFRASEIKLAAERKAGALLAELERGQGQRNDLTSANVGASSEYKETIDGAGITGQEARRWQTEAQMPEDEYQELVEDLRDKNKELTSHGVYSEAKKRQTHQERAERMQELSDELVTLGVKLHHDDALKRILMLDDESIALVVTDPPYNTTAHEWDKYGNRSDFIAWTSSWLNAVRPKLANEYHLFVFCDADYMADMEMLMRADGWPIKSRIIWEYRNLVRGRTVTDKFIENYQVCFHCGNHALNWFDEWDDRRFMVQRHATPQSNFNEGKHHPTAKPVSLFKLLIEVGSKPGDIMLDCFAGGGTAGVASEQVGQRHCILIERDDAFCEVIEARLNIQRGE